jgi:hypothetical protein
VQAAIITEQGITFAIVLVQKIGSPFENEHISNKLSPVFGDMPVVLMTKNSEGREQVGREDLVNITKDIPFGAIPFREYQD